MNLAPSDLHLVFDDTSNRLVVWDAHHQPIFKSEARNSAVNDGTYGHFGNCPRGEFLMGTPEWRNSVPFGHWFTPINDYAGFHAMADHGRGFIGMHGGGSGLADPLAPAQGWMETEGCIRLQNWANDYVVSLIQHHQHLGGKVFLSVTGAN